MAAERGLVSGALAGGAAGMLLAAAVTALGWDGPVAPSLVALAAAAYGAAGGGLIASFAALAPEPHSLARRSAPAGSPAQSATP